MNPTPSLLSSGGKEERLEDSMKRKIVQIDQDKCNGCGLCIPSCAEGALKIVDGKARLVSDRHCDGLGACLGRCPQDAIRIIEREAEAFDEDTVKAIQEKPQPKQHACACSGSQIRQHQPSLETSNDSTVNSQLAHWPIQLHLVPVNAPFFQNADLLVAASCVPFSYGDFHNAILSGKSLIIACPKLDRTDSYLEKLTEIFRQNEIKSVTVAIMEVPCCQGLLRLVRQALKDSGKRRPITVEMISVKGQRL